MEGREKEGVGVFDILGVVHGGRGSVAMQFVDVCNPVIDRLRVLLCVLNAFHHLQFIQTFIAMTLFIKKRLSVRYQLNIVQFEGSKWRLILGNHKSS